MRFLLDVSENKYQNIAGDLLVAGQLITPLTRYSKWASSFAIDNGAFSRFDPDAFRAIIAREQPAMEQCLFVVAPDVVGNARRTMELWVRRHRYIGTSWPIAFAAQDGAEHLTIPWNEMKALFIGGTDSWKDGCEARDLVKTAKILGLHVHIGRVNTPKRFKHFSDLGADTCDGNGVGRYDHMLNAIRESLELPENGSLWDLPQE